MTGGNWNWPPEMQAEYDKWLAENEQTCLCLNCLQARMSKVRKLLKLKSGKARL